eukprot:6211816-Pleurochrysis_carterae.AAC.3
MGSRAGGLVEQLRNLVDQRRFDEDLSCLSADEVKKRRLPVTSLSDNASYLASDSGTTHARAGD